MNTSGFLFTHDCVIFVDQWQNEDLGKLQVTKFSIEFIGANLHLLFDIHRLNDVKKELGFVKLFDNKQEVHMFRFLKRPPYTKWEFFSSKICYENDEIGAKNFISLVNTILMDKKVESASSIKEKVIVKETVLIPCKYCGGLMSQTEIACPNCGARRK